MYIERCRCVVMNVQVFPIFGPEADRQIGDAEEVVADNSVT